MKVLSYNILNGGEDRLPLIESVIRYQQPDVVAIQEANSRANAETLADRLEMYLAFGEANSPFHLAWLSRLPLLRVSNHRLPTLVKTLLEVEVPWEESTIRLFATHLSSRHDAHSPAEEVPAILEVLRSLQDVPHLLVGDFNALRPGDHVGEPPPKMKKWEDAAEGSPRHAIGLILDAGYVDCYRALHPGDPGYTYPSDHPWLRLDFVFASPAMAERLHACDVVREGEVEVASDHLPVWAEFSRQ